MRPELEQAAARLRENTPESVAEAIALLQRTVFRFSMKICGHPEDAEDTMQEVLMRSAPHLVRLVDAQALAVWLYTVTRNRCWRMRRKPAGASGPTLSLDELIPSEEELAALATRFGSATSDPSPEEAAIHSQQQQLVHRAVLSIPPQYRMVLVLHDMEDLDVAQIAQVLDLKPGTVRVRLHRARLAVRKAMAVLLDRSISGVGQQKSRRGAQPGRAAAKKGKRSTGSGSGPAVGAVSARSAACREIFAKLSEFLDDRLPRPDCERISRHIEHCPNCVLFLRDLRQAMERCRSLDLSGESPCDPEVHAALHAQLSREYLRLTGSSAA
jgi:RNA polymerase sigma-70 factor (ECF subfamily)